MWTTTRRAEQLFAESMQMTVYPVLAELTWPSGWPIWPCTPQAATSFGRAEAKIDRLLAELG